MAKLAWISCLTVLLVAAGGTAYYYVRHERSEAPPAVAPLAPDVPTEAASTKRNDELQQRKLDGIGSTKNLKPVPIPQGNAR